MIVTVLAIDWQEQSGKCRVTALARSLYNVISGRNARKEGILHLTEKCDRKGHHDPFSEVRAD